MTCGPYTRSASARVRATHAVSHLNHVGLPPGLPRRVLVDVGELRRVARLVLGVPTKPIGEPTRAARRRRHAGADHSGGPTPDTAVGESAASSSV